MSWVELPYKALRSNVANALDLLIHIDRRFGVRSVSEAVPVKTYDPGLDRYEFRPSINGTTRDEQRRCAATFAGISTQIQFLHGHVSIETTERYLGCKQRIRSAVHDRIGIEPGGLSSSAPGPNSRR